MRLRTALLDNNLRQHWHNQGMFGLSEALKTSAYHSRTKIRDSASKVNVFRSTMVASK